MTPSAIPAYDDLRDTSPELDIDFENAMMMEGLLCDDDDDPLPDVLCPT